jgi:hypothetical protein
MCLVDSCTINTILSETKYFQTLTKRMGNILIIAGHDICIVGFEKTIIIFSMGTQVIIKHALLCPDYTRTLLSYRDIHKNRLHIVTVTPGFKIKIRCSSYVYSGSSCHTYSHNVNTKNQCLYYINFITRLLSLQRRLYRLSCWTAAKTPTPQANRPREMQASRRNLHFSSPSHIHLPSSVITRVSRLMVATQYVKGKHNSIYAGCKETTVLLQKAPYT